VTESARAVGLVAPGAPNDRTVIVDDEVGTEVASHLNHAPALHAESPAGIVDSSTELDAGLVER
jgi:hypothetical protein